MPKHAKKKTTSVITVVRSGPRKPHYRYLEAQPKAGYSREHRCHFCGARGYAYVTTRSTAKLFCGPTCFQLHRRYLLQHMPLAIAS